MPRLRLSTIFLLLLTASTALAQSPDLKSGDAGPAVERLQKLLNARLKPSPDLTVDGDLGAATLAALQRYQKAQGLPVTTTVDARVWTALGPLTPADEVEAPVPPPDVVNAEKRTKKPPDSLDGPPFTTAKAWALADGQTGQLLAGFEAETPLEMASTTKMMTALLVARLAANEPQLLDEVLTFSEQADRTPGSTSDVKAGETVPVRELLYGLMLPSGNDAAAAFAQHFGPRFEPESPAPEASQPIARFVAQMNRTAKALAMNETHFANPHGLPAPDHHASARDLARLAAAVLADPILAPVVATPKHGATLHGPAPDQSRNIVWTNTNRLLDTEGYDGVKTGTTTAAGNCLVASGHRDGKHRIVVILGSSSSDGRYADARNLFRWAWQQH
jgi:D-alanyl-D-alanine carboxypeptidase (penicillin-binding protein 5/6)